MNQPATEEDTPEPPVPAFLRGGGEMGQRIRAFDWSQTPLGPVAGWPQSLQTAVGIMLHAKAAIGIYWGEQLTLLYNDAWCRLIAGKHPAALGRPGSEVFPEIWETVGPLLAQVTAGEGATAMEAQLLPLRRGDALEDAWFDYSFSPIVRQDGSIGGVFNIATEVTERVRAQQERQEREEQLRLVSRAAKLGVYARDLRTGEDYWSPEFLAIYGLEPDEPLALEERIPLAVHPEDREAVRREARARLQRTIDPEFSSEHRIIRPDGEVRWVLVQGQVAFDDQGQPLGTYGIVLDITERKRAEEALRQRERELAALTETLEDQVQERTREVRELAAQLTMAEHEERGHVAQILHDDLQQLLYALQIQLRFVRSYLPQDKAVTAEVVQMEKAILDAVQITRRLSVDLSPPILEGEGLTEAIRWLAAHMEEQYGLLVTLDSDPEGDSFRVPALDRRVLLFQMVRELLFNVVKHSGVMRATVCLRYTEMAPVDRAYAIDVVDRGAGFDAASVLAPESASQGRGLRHLQERLALAGGRLEVVVTPGEGTRVTIIVPVGQPAGPAKPA